MPDVENGTRVELPIPHIQISSQERTMGMQDTLPILLFCCMVAITVFSFAYPWRVEGPVSRVLMHTPLLLIPCFIAYEASIPMNLEIRFDLVVVAMLMIASFFGYCVKWFALQRPPQISAPRRPAPRHAAAHGRLRTA